MHKKKVELGDLVEICPCWRHGWFESNVGRVRKPVTYSYVNGELHYTLG